ncbi:mitochondrial import receptor subunit Tom37 like protein [Zymoseptoria brevis]|uniref:Mitochondrial import receptor subunit Tom37 like protein n=1 Tax=Zymoseptoria brevis TaxID=1047168 RepID=A0A0F4GXB1_9PEZI|nr:mitochondrial import receptor subunit Tom37 like protein [Zymoseptoria brevis]
MQLFILGPAFGLPSINAECNAAVALLQLHGKNEYDLVLAHEQKERLPYLIDGELRIHGFSNIARHLSETALEPRHDPLTATQRADSIAVTSFLGSNAQILLDISLYVGFENYRLTTRPAFTKILPWHANYIIPPQRRAAARSRTEHLGISSIDVDNVHEDMSNRPPGYEAVGKEEGFEKEAQARASLLLPKKNTLKSLLQTPERASIFKLQALADNFFGPLADVLGEKHYLLGTEEATSVDCLMYGFLALMLFPKVPQDWLASTMRQRYGKLAAFVERVHATLKLRTDVEEVVKLMQCKTRAELWAQRETSKSSLPWTIEPGTSIVETFRNIGKALIEQIPFIGSPNSLQLLNVRQASAFSRHMRAVVLSATASIALSGYIAFHTGLLVWPRGEEVHIFGRKRFSDLGHLGAALAGVNLLGPPRPGRGP